MIEIPLGLRHALETGECVLFIGAGIGNHLTNKQGDNAPTGKELTTELAQHFNVTIDEYTTLDQVAEIVEIRKGRRELCAFIKQRLADLEPDSILKWLFGLRWKAIYTTNYDYGIQRTYELNSDPKQNCVTISATSELKSYEAYYEVPVYHLHGILFGEADPKIIITSGDYAKFKDRRKMLFDLLKKDFATSTILYIGYSNRDPNWRTVLEEIKTEFYPSKLPQSFRVTPEEDPITQEILKSSGITTIVNTLEEFVKSLQLELEITKLEVDKLKEIKELIPTDLVGAFEKSPAAVARLVSSWQYVNQAKFNEQPNISDFVRGDRPNWALIASNYHFERDIEEEVYDSLLDYLTGTNNYPTLRIILGPAGYGITTILMSLTTKLIQERACAVFMHIPGRPLLEGDIEFAASLFPDKPFFIVDNAADYSEEVHSIIYRFRETDRTAMFVLGERLNEWRQGHGKLNGREFALESLSDPEIIRLLDFLAKHNLLDKLEDLSPELRFAVIKEKHGKELLVVMREATEDKSFDAILEDEFRGIGEETAQKLYLIVCCFYQHGAYVRDNLLSDLLDERLEEMYKKTSACIEGVVIYDEIDQNLGIYGARARHRTIAAVVWERCGFGEVRESILQESINTLNLAHKVDRDAFEYFIRSDRLVDSISTLDGKIRFFETACRKDPDNPYVRQHFARMLNRAQRPVLALSQIEEAIKNDPRVRVLYHTKGKILASIAITTESDEIARRRLAQSKENFRLGISMYDKDEYCYQGLAELYFNWAKRIDDENESSEYISRAEETISEGLKKVRVRDGLWIVSSTVQDYLGDEPSSIIALERAVQATPSSVFARYCLGRAYRKMNEPKKALKMLDPVIKSHFDEFRLFVEYALAQIDLGDPYKNAISTLELSTLYGLSDAKFIATLGGLQLLDGRLSDAEKTFDESTKRHFSAQELNKIHFKPYGAETNSPLRIEGKVVKVKAGYALIESKDFPVFLCPGSKYNGLIMEERLRLSFEPAFTAKGKIAVNPQRIN